MHTWTGAVHAFAAKSWVSILSSKINVENYCNIVDFSILSKSSKFME